MANERCQPGSEKLPQLVRVPAHDAANALERATTHAINAINPLIGKRERMYSEFLADAEAANAQRLTGIAVERASGKP